MQQPPVEALARSYTRTASAAFRDQAAYFGSLPDDAWSDPTGCAQWTMHQLAGHIAGEAVWFPSLVRGVTEGAPPLPDELWEQLKRLPGKELAGRMTEAAQELVLAVDDATPDQLQQIVDLGFKVPLWQALYVCMFEAVLHNWDGRARREPGVTIPTDWAVDLASFMVEFGPGLAQGDAAREAAGRSLLQVGDGVGPITVTAQDGAVTIEHDQVGTPDTTIHLTADQYVRLLAGRLPIDSAIGRGEVTVAGDRARAESLNRIFAGVGS